VRDLAAEGDAVRRDASDRDDPRLVLLDERLQTRPTLDQLRDRQLVGSR
jgi:hypothetical protein